MRENSEQIRNVGQNLDDSEPWIFLLKGHLTQKIFSIKQSQIIPQNNKRILI